MIYLQKAKILKHTFLISILYFFSNLTVVAQSFTNNFSIVSPSEGMGIIEKYDAHDKQAVKNFKKKSKEVKKIKLISEKIQKRMALENATIISNASLHNFQKAEIIQTAKEFIGTPYHYGGMTKEWNRLLCSNIKRFR